MTWLIILQALPEVHLFRVRDNCHMASNVWLDAGGCGVGVAPTRMGWGSCWKIRIKPQKENNLGVAHALFDHKGDDNKKDNQVFRLLTSNAVFSTDDPPAFVIVLFCLYF